MSEDGDVDYEALRLRFPVGWGSSTKTGATWPRGTARSADALIDRRTVEAIDAVRRSV